MDLLSNEEYKKLILITESCYNNNEIISEEQCNKIMNELKSLISFDYWGLAYAYYDTERLHVEELSWFRGIEGFEQKYINQKLFLVDPVALEGIRQIKENDFSVQFWPEIYSRNPESEFFTHLKDFPISQWSGYSILYPVNLLQVIGFSITGPKLKMVKDQKTIKILNYVHRGVSNIALAGKIGKLSKLTDRQFRYYQLMKTGLTIDHISKVMGVSRSTVEKTFATIRKKLDINSKKELIFGFSNT